MATVGWDAGRKKTLTIAQAAQNSDVLNLGSEGVREGYIIGILNPATLTGTVTVEVCDTATGTFRTLQSNALDVALPVAKAVVLDPFPFPFMRLHSSGAEAAARSFVIQAHSAR
jgi:hypothetical protein